MLEIEEREGAVHFRVKVQARARREEIAGEHDGALKVRLTAPAIEGRANRALCRLLAECLKVPASSVKIVSGERAPRKVVAVTGVAAAAVRALGLDDSPRP